MIGEGLTIGIPTNPDIEGAAVLLYYCILFTAFPAQLPASGFAGKYSTVPVPFALVPVCSEWPERCHAGKHSEGNATVEQLRPFHSQDFWGSQSSLQLNVQHSPLSMNGIMLQFPALPVAGRAAVQGKL